ARVPNARSRMGPDARAQAMWERFDGNVFVSARHPLATKNCSRPDRDPTYTRTGAPWPVRARRAASTRALRSTLVPVPVFSSTTMTTESTRLSVTEKVGYSLGDLSANLIFQTLMTFLAFYYTDVYKIPPATAATIIFVGGLFGAFFTPVMGVIADRTNTRWGKFRPWILWTSIPFGVIAVLAFSTPDFGSTGKAAYAFCTYILLVLV